MIGRTIAHYRIIAKLGEGGMGEVFRAEDTRLQRQVALKVLPEEMASDPERLKRFKREAQSIAALNHPNIVTLYSVEEAGDLHLLTMELIEGDSLDRVLPGSGFEVERMLPIAGQVADALVAAHDKGIVHRDLKPGNVMVSSEDRVKILDFGLAKLAEAEEPTDEVTQLLTQDGMILGTVPYMSPEQIQAQAVDHRSDIFSLGVLLYEMATGERPFRGDNPASVISAVLKEQPPLVTELKAELPNHLGRIVRRCLEKPPDRRYQSARDVQLELEGLERELTAGSAPSVERAPVAVAPARPVWLVPTLGAAALAAVGLAWMGLYGRGDRGGDGARAGRAGAPRVRSLSQVTDFVGTEAFPSLSPDGKQIAYASTRNGVTDIHLLRIGGENPINLTRGSGVIDTHPAFSPDGEQIAFRSDRQGGGIFLMGATGESVRRVTDFGYHPSWSPDGHKIAFSTDSITEPSIRTTRGSAWVVDVASGETRQILDRDSSQPSWSPDGRRLVFWGLVPGSGRRDLWTVAADGTDLVRLTDDDHLDWNPVWSAADGHVYFASDRGGSRDLWRIPLDPVRGAASGVAEAVTVGSAGVDQPTLARNGGRVAFVSKFARNRVERVAFDPEREAISGQFETVLESSAAINTAWLSKDGERLLYWAAGKRDAIFVAALDGSERRVLVRDDSRNRSPAWCDDERTVLFSSDRGGRYEIWSIGSDGSGLRQLTRDSEQSGGAMLPICMEGSNRLYFTEMGVRTLEARYENGEIAAPEPLPSFQGDGYVVFWGVSPDRSKLGGSLWQEGAAVAAMVYDIATREYRKVDFERPVPLGSALNRWLADGRRLVLTLEGKLMIFDTEQLELRPMAGAGEDPLRLVDVSRDGQEILVLRPVTNEDVWLIELESSGG